MEFGCELFGSGMLWWAMVISGMAVLFFWPDKRKEGEAALDILHKKFAEGALSVEEYQERKTILEQNKRK